MKKVTFITLLPICLLTAVICYAASSEQSEVIRLTRPEDIRGASTMDQAIVSLGNKVMQCVQGKLAPANECYCLYPQDLSRVRKTYRSVMKEHPDWKNKVVSYTLEGKSHAVSLGGIGRQLEKKCPQRR